MWNSHNILTFTILSHFRTVPTGTVRILWFFLVLRNFWVGTVKKNHPVFRKSKKIDNFLIFFGESQKYDSGGVFPPSHQIRLRDAGASKKKRGGGGLLNNILNGGDTSSLSL